MGTQHMTFGSLTIDYDDRVLEPRSWTIAQSEWAAELARGAPDGPVLELCAGAGQIGLLAATLQSRSLVCVDMNPSAVEYIRANAEAAGMGDRVEVRLASLDSALAEHERFPLVIADPPWVPSAQTGLYRQDPLLAIDGGGDGLDVAWACVRIIDRHLLPGGSAVLQLGGQQQAEAMRRDLPAGLVGGETRQFERGLLWRLDKR